MPSSFYGLSSFNPQIGFPHLVKQKMQNKSLTSLKPKISWALALLLDKLRSITNSKAMCINHTFSPLRHSLITQILPERVAIYHITYAKLHSAPTLTIILLIVVLNSMGAPTLVMIIQRIMSL